MSKAAIGVKVFDPARLEAMTEPLSVRVEKLKGNSRTPIPLPAGDDGSTQGSNWSKDDVRGLEQWLVTDWSGGGMYAITVTDSSMPTPQKHDWTIFYNPQDYPEKVPPTLSAAAAHDRPIAPSQPQQVRQMGSFPSAFTNGLPAGNVPGQPTTVYVQQPAPAPQPYYQREPFVRHDPNAAALAAAEVERRRMEDQLKEMQAQLIRAREEQMQAQHRQELERAEARMRAEANAQNEKFSKLEQMIAALATANARPAVDPAIEALKEQNRILAARAENEAREREAERREREMRDMMQRNAEESRRAIEAMQVMITANQNKGPDPMLMFLQENARQQVEAVKEQARNQTAQMAQMQAYMMNPRDVMAMAKESSNGLDQATRSITSTYQSILEMQRNAVEQILQLNSGGGNETIALIEKGLERASSMAERYLGGKTREAVSAQQTQAELAKANATAMQAQAQAMTVQASMARQAQQQAQQPQPDAGLNGPRIVPAEAGPNGETRVSQTSSAGNPANNGWSTGPVPAIVPIASARRVHGRTDEEWFGPILPKVNELREGVDRCIESLTMNPPRLDKEGGVDGIEAEKAALVILQAAQIVMAQQLPILAMMELLGQGRIADFMDVLLPNAPQPYRDEVAQMLLHELSGGNDEDEDEDENEDEDEDNDDINVNNNPNTPPQPRKPTNGRARA
ncbi:MAG: hypothetical protein ACREJC_06965 [Tepidisphaeraceae bacterium]